jgi:uncharacterized protein (DUF2235 family)
LSCNVDLVLLFGRIAEGRGAMPKNIVICCDGTGNEIGRDISNVLKLFRIALKDEQQHVYYNPGIGTIAKLATWGRIRQKVSEVFGLATGYGLDDNIVDAYSYLCGIYDEGDRIFLFGFSRGAYTVRAVAGMVDMLGLLRPDQFNIDDYALTAYKRAAEQNDLKIAWQFGKIADGRRVPIDFIGVWDTVASVIVPRPDRMYIPSLEFLPYTAQNPSVRVFRQACAIDERRAMFRLYHWLEGKLFKPDPYSANGSIAQDVKQVWFAGVHGDVGGGYAENQSAVSKFPLIWMIREAVENGLSINQSMFDHLALGEPEAHGLYNYVAPNTAGEIHQSLKWYWWPLEVWPKRTKYREWPRRPSILGLYLPLAEPRAIPDGALIHQSVIDRMNKEDLGYDPPNLPQQRVIVPTHLM